MSDDSANENRVQNLRILTGIFCTQENLAKELDIKPYTLGSYGRRDQAMPEQVARAIEAKLKKPSGWMDRPNFEMNITFEEWNLIQKHRLSSNQQC